MPVGKSAVRELEEILRGEPDLLAVRDIADLTQSDERTVRRWIAASHLAALQKSARGFLIPKKALIRFLTADSEAAPA